MKPGTVKPTDVSQVVPLEQATPTAQVEQVQDKKRINLDEANLEGRSQLPPVAPSRTDSTGESALVRNRVQTGQAQQARTKGKRQKFLKVAEAKNLSKAARAAFKTLADLLSRAVSILGRFTRKLLEDDDEDEQQRRRQHHEQAIENAEEEKIEPSEVPRGLKPLPT